MTMIKKKRKKERWGELERVKREDKSICYFSFVRVASLQHKKKKTNFIIAFADKLKASDWSNLCLLNMHTN